ncbi:MAG: hypothetical protein ABII68_08325 [Pseudomonadota bacterium]
MSSLPRQEPEISEANDSRIRGRARNPKNKKEYLCSSKKKKNSGRKCKICGKDPYPNYFFCPSCHHRINEDGESETPGVHFEES